MTTSDYCPLYVDYVRECLFSFGDMPCELQTMGFCISERHEKCPFFRYLQSPEAYCTYFPKCSLCKQYKGSDFEGLVELADAWCLNNYTSCVRCQMKQAGKTPPETLLPDGTTLKVADPGNQS